MYPSVDTTFHKHVRKYLMIILAGVTPRQHLLDRARVWYIRSNNPSPRATKYQVNELMVSSRRPTHNSGLEPISMHE